MISHNPPSVRGELAVALANHTREYMTFRDKSRHRATGMF